jgi:hypothetical protein
MVLAIALARTAAATACAAVQSTAPLFRRRRPAGFPALRPRAALTGCLKLQGHRAAVSAINARLRADEQQLKGARRKGLARA